MVLAASRANNERVGQSGLRGIEPETEAETSLTCIAGRENNGTAAEIPGSEQNGTGRTVYRERQVLQRNGITVRFNGIEDHHHVESVYDPSGCDNLGLGLRTSCFSSPPVIAGVSPPGQTVEPVTLAVPFQPIHPLSLPVFWIVRITFEAPIPPPLLACGPSNTSDARAEPVRPASRQRETAPLR